jgi:hypothetical protein
MAIFPCDKKGLCIDPSTPFANLSAELPDQEIFIGRNTGFGPSYPPLGSLFLAVGCTSFCESTVSQQDADLCAANGNINCLSPVWPVETAGTDVFGNPVPVPQNRPIYRNAAQSVTVSCPDGNPFVYTVPAGKYFAFSQAIADATALSDAQTNAPNFLVCIGDLAATQFCAGVPYNDSVTASGNFLTDANACWAIIGSLPPGLSTNLNFVDDCFTGSRTLSFFGTPTVPGNYSFAIQVQDSRGDVMVKPVTMRVMGIMGVNPMPDGAVGTAYSQFLNGAGVTNPIYSLESGALPDGLQLDTTGVIFGTPTTPGTSNFVLGVTEAGTGLTCATPASVTVTSSFGFSALVWGVPVIGGGTAQSSSAASAAGNTASAEAHRTAAGFFTNPTASITSDGNLPYSGPMLACNAHCNLTQMDPIGAGNVCGLGFNVLQDGVSVGSGVLNNPNVPGGYDFPFNLNATAGSLIQVQVSAGINPSGAPIVFDVKGTWTFTPA